MTETRKEVLEKLLDLETKKSFFTHIKAELTKYGQKQDAVINVTSYGSYIGSSVPVSHDLFIAYIEKEIDLLEEAIDEGLKDLKHYKK